MISQVISQYQILEKLSEGGRGIPCNAQDATLNRVVALTFLPRRLTLDEAFNTQVEIVADNMTAPAGPGNMRISTRRVGKACSIADHDAKGSSRLALPLGDQSAIFLPDTHALSGARPTAASDIAEATRE